MSSQQIPSNSMFSHQISSDISQLNDTTVDPITKCKDLLPQLKQSLLVILILINFFFVFFFYFKFFLFNRL